MMRPAILALLAAVSASASAQTVPTADFSSIELRGGGTVTVRHGAARQVTVLSGDAASRPIRVEAGRLIVGECRRPCPGGHRIVIEVTAPELTGVAVRDGGTIQVESGFPAQAAIAAAVDDGGTIDLRALAAARVSAAVQEGGRIFATAGRDLAASVSNGGIVTYWGEARVQSAISGGGVVVRGDAANRQGPLARFDPTLPRLPTPPRPPGTH